LYGLTEEEIKVVEETQRNKIVGRIKQ